MCLSPFNFSAKSVCAALAAALLLVPAVSRADDPAALKDVTPGAFASNANLHLGNGIDFGNGVFVALGNDYSVSTLTGNGYSFTSADGVVWKTHQLDFIPSGKLRFADGKFIVYKGHPEGNGEIYTSTDGLSWSSIADPSSYGPFVGLATGNGTTVLARGAGIGGHGVSITSDGSQYTSAALPVTSNFTAITDIAYGAGLFAVVGAGIEQPFYLTSPDGQSWTVQPGLDYSNGYSFINYGNGTFLTQENGASQHVSADGVTWKLASPGYMHDVPGAGTFAVALRYGRFLNGQFVGLSAFNSVATSADAQNWTEIATGPDQTKESLRDITFGNGHYVTTGEAHIYTDATGPAPVVKAADLSLDFADVKVGPNAKGTKTKFKGKLTVSNSGKRPAADVQVSAYLSADNVFLAADDQIISSLNLADLGFPTLAKKGGTTGALNAKFVAKPADLGPTSGKYLLIVVDPGNAISETDKTNNVFAYGPLP